jgi:stearoyl-CoA desaturase (delta-9 desaturase)
MQLVAGSERIIAEAESDPVNGQIRWAPAKSLWIGSITAGALVLGPLFFSWSAFALFLATSAMTLCFGHSVGMHRRLIHGSFQCPLWLEYVCVYLGVLVGMAGPIGMIRVHDMRDWAQRQAACHDYFAHRAGFWLDGWRQLHCALWLERPPAFQLEPRLAGDRVYAFLERSWMWQQLPWAALFFALGGPSWVVWGVCMRVTVCITGHWLVGHFAHRQGDQSFVVEGASVQGYNVRMAGLISMGESWHNNHHAFPGSARIGLHPGEVDLGWLLICAFGRIGLAWDVITPDQLPHRAAVRRVRRSKPPGCPIARRLGFSRASPKQALLLHDERLTLDLRAPA